MAATSEPDFAVDLFAFWNENAWDVPDIAELARLGRAEPRALWDRLLGMLRRSGVGAIEVTFAPFDWRTAIAAYGGVAGLTSALDDHGLRICGGYLPQLEDEAALAPERRRDLLAAVDEYADFLAETGATALIGSAPPRATPGGGPARFVDLAEARRLAVPFHEVGRAARRAGIRFGLHTESHSAMWLERDIDLFMLATDPCYVGLCPDAAHIVLGGGDPVAVASRHAGRLVSAHWKDAVSAMPWDVPDGEDVHARHREYFRVPGRGVVDWPRWAAELAGAGLTTPVLLEIDASPDPVADISAAIDHLTPVLASLA
ncbi:sugar phosphate isomerase/epimerase family protein [Streptomyces millisiae]|uniref:Sugar phosphate isomerase/epimerase n=1 Tax=Streptomyces millisiae TaxID=3075542 RepID=A0ABU2M100_9ACTN|nr:sugar phosphate isomerase/epimerase [Streptomyces sp. DSM 44918]MDT0322948.1 sugar phosphate isomerase/epimerase [Streptomyces sp. DSM 44918]